MNISSTMLDTALGRRMAMLREQNRRSDRHSDWKTIMWTSVYASVIVITFATAAAAWMQANGTIYAAR